MSRHSATKSISSSSQRKRHGKSGSKNSSSLHFLSILFKNLQEQKAKTPKTFINNEQIETDQVYEKNVTNIYIETGGSDGSPRILKCKLNALEDETLLAIQQSLPLYTQLTELRLEFCNLTYEQVLFLRMILMENKNIIYLSINGNPKWANEEEPKHTLPVEGTSLKMISEQFCDLGPQEAILFHKLLTKPDSFSSCLVSLNLASNQLGNEGCAIIGGILRGNRFLQSLNISDNNIKESALVGLFGAFNRFEMEPHEMRFKKLMNIEKLQKLQKSGSLSDISLAKKKSGSSKSLTLSKSGSTFFVSEISLLSNHPFINDTFQENGVFYCHGNYSLMFLNISFNEITPSVMERIIDTVYYQKRMFQQPSGLLRVFVENLNQSAEHVDRLAIALKSGQNKTSLKVRPASSN